MCARNRLLLSGSGHTAFRSIFLITISSGKVLWDSFPVALLTKPLQSQQISSHLTKFTEYHCGWGTITHLMKVRNEASPESHRDVQAVEGRGFLTRQQQQRSQLPPDWMCAQVEGVVSYRLGCMDDWPAVLCSQLPFHSENKGTNLTWNRKKCLWYTETHIHACLTKTPKCFQKWDRVPIYLQEVTPLSIKSKKIH